MRAGHRIDLDRTLFSKETNLYLDRLLEITRIAGGALSSTLDRYSLVLGTREQTKTELEVAVAGPRASSRLVMSLPILVLVGAGISGLPIFRVLATPSVVWVSLAVGALLFWLGSRWITRVLTKAQPSFEDVGFDHELLGIGLGAGLPLANASELVPELDVSELQEISLGSGVALTQLVLDRANSLRLEKLNADRLRIQKASVAVLWPLGLIVLPAFVLIAIVPIAAALIQSQ